jgi:hypothetical protein
LSKINKKEKGREMSFLRYEDGSMKRVRLWFTVIIPCTIVLIMAIISFSLSIVFVGAGYVKVLTEWGKTAGVTFYSRAAF